MGTDKSWTQLGTEFKETIEEALSSGDFGNINDLITDTVSLAIDEAKKQAYNIQAQYQSENDRVVTPQEFAVKNDERKQRLKQEKEWEKSVPKVVKAGRTKAILFNIFGGLGAFFFVPSMLIVLLAGAGFPAAVIMTAFSLLFVWMIISGCTTLGRISRAERYRRLAMPNEYISVDDIASHMGKDKKFVLKDLQKILESGMYPEGHIDNNKSCLILTNRMYRTYMDMEKNRIAIEEQNRRELERLEMEKKQLENNPELEEMIREGSECVKRLRELNDLIEGEVISAKLYKMENLLKEILAKLKQQPEKMHDMHKLMNYYLPTTLKLVTAYSEFDDVASPGEDIVNAKQQIENTLDTINSAYNELLNGFFREKVFDVTTDAQVLESVLSREGLVGDDFRL